MRRSGLLRWAILCIFFFAVTAAALSSIAAILGWLAWRDAFPDAINQVIKSAIGIALDFLRLNQYTIISYLTRATAVISGLTGLYGLLNAWYYLDTELPRRIADLLNRVLKSGIENRAILLNLAFAAGDDHTFVMQESAASPISRFSREVRADNDASTARWLAASAKELEEEYSQICSAQELAQHRAVTARLVRGRYFTGAGDNSKAHVEFRLALDINSRDLDALSAAAGCARRLSLEDSELDYLRKLYLEAQRSRADRAKLYEAAALRREAEILSKRLDGRDLKQARDRARAAINLSNTPGSIASDQNIELGRALTLFCEIQLKRRVPGLINSKISQTVKIFENVPMSCPPDEFGSNSYGHARAQKLKSDFETFDPKDANRGTKTD